MLIPVCRATHTMPRRTTLLQAIPSRTDSRSTRPHIRDASRARVPGCYTSGRTRTPYSQRALIRLATSMKHRSIIREPYQAHASHKAARSGSSYALGRVSVFVSVRRFWRGFHRQMSLRCSFFLENSVEWVRCSSCMHTLWCLWCRLAMPRLMPSVSRMGLCGSLFVVRHSLCQLVSFFHAELFFFFGPCLFERLVTNFSFDLPLRKFRFEFTISFLLFMI